MMTEWDTGGPFGLLCVQVTGHTCPIWLLKVNSSKHGIRQCGNLLWNSFVLICAVYSVHHLAGATEHTPYHNFWRMMLTLMDFMLDSVLDQYQEYWLFTKLERYKCALSLINGWSVVSGWWFWSSRKSLQNVSCVHLPTSFISWMMHVVYGWNCVMCRILTVQTCIALKLVAEQVFKNSE
jgi:hypothetical protein